MSSDLEVIKAIVAAFERSDWAEIDVRSGSLRVHLSTQAHSDADATPATAAAQPAETVSAPGTEPSPAVVIPAGAQAVRSPSPGIFWRSPHPGAPPFAEVGDDMQSGATLGIVEVMKLMNHISSTIAGAVVGVFVENGMRVDRGDVLFALQPPATA